jgi:hypothetical protein
MPRCGHPVPPSRAPLAVLVVCTPDSQGHLIYLALAAHLGAVRPRFSVHSSPMKLD